MELGIYTFGELTPDPVTGEQLTPTERMRDLLEGSSSRTTSAWTSSASASTTGPTTSSRRLPSS